MTGPLAGIRIIDTTAYIAGPLATMVLADQGAEVIKVEPPGIGDALRLLGALRGGMSAFFATSNRSKRSLVLNLKQERGVEVLRRLVGQADVFVQNYRPGVVERLGIDYESLRRDRPELVYVSISGFGETGPYAHRPVFDNVIQALSGMASAQANPETGAPDMIRNIVCDKVTALTAAQAMTAAIVARERGRGGQHLRLAMLDAAVAFFWPDGMMNHTYLGEGALAMPPLAHNYRALPTADGYMTMTAVTDDQFGRACRALGRPELADDPRYRTLPDRIERLSELVRMLTEVLRTRPTAEWCERFEKEEVPYAPIHTLEALCADPQLAENGTVVEVEHPVAGRMRQARPAPRFERTPAVISRPAPAAGQHTDELLTEAGFSADQVSALRADGVVA
jgi:crotonobetainyl-CoA:carnitine CoA-transferase CaiB-like acyl-CoA transferase